MSTDYAEKEREFIAGLSEDTGRDLDAWMAAISQSGLNERNAIIDWLRHQGFQFAKASWLERIHHNGGRLIYANDIGIAKQIARSTQPSENAQPAVNLERAVADTLQDIRPPQSTTSARDDIGPLLAACKGLRPLAEHLLREIGRGVPNVQIYAGAPFIVVAAPLPFAALQPNPKKIRLFGDFGPLSGRVKAAEATARTAPPFAAMLLFDDAREVDEDFQRLIRVAARR